MSPLERGARALSLLDGHPVDAMLGDKPMWHDYLAPTRAVLAAIREPSADMTKAGETLRGSSSTRWMWSCMVDAALADGSPDTQAKP